MTEINKILVSIVTLTLIAMSIYGYGLYQYYEGKKEVQLRWDAVNTANALQEAIEAARRKVIQDDINTQHGKNIAAAVSKAGRDAVRKYIASIGLLSMQRPNSETNSITNSTQGTNEASSESGSREALERFATRCGLDALQIDLFHDWIKKVGFPIEE